MKLELHRDEMLDVATLGKLKINGEYFCETLEDTDRKLESGGAKIHGRTCIPRGTYEVLLDWSPRFKQIMPRLLNVPGFEGVRIHPGNNSGDTDGCILVGLFRGAAFIGRSRPAYGRLMQVLEETVDRNERITITIT